MEWLKKHAVLIGGLLLAGIVAYYLYQQSGSSSGADSTDAADAAAQAEQNSLASLGGGGGASSPISPISTMLGTGAPAPTTAQPPTTQQLAPDGNIICPAGQYPNAGHCEALGGPVTTQAPQVGTIGSSVLPIADQEHSINPAIITPQNPLTQSGSGTGSTLTGTLGLTGLHAPVPASQVPVSVPISDAPATIDLHTNIIEAAR